MAAAGLLALGVAVKCGGTTTEERRSADPVGDASSGSVAWCTGAVALSTGSEGDAVCVVKADGSLWCWGASGCGSLGIAGTKLVVAPVPVPRDGLAGIESISIGWGTTCALGRAGVVACWGNALPHGAACSGTPSPMTVTGLPRGISAVATGYDHACALATDGSAWCWGTNDVGQLGDGTTVGRAAAAPVTGLTSGVAAISAGHAHSCALKTDGSLWCWGTNFAGDIGDGTATTRTTPVLVSGMSSGVASVAVGSDHVCAVKTDGTAWCWGNNGAGELGDGTEATRLVPAPVKLPLGATAVAAGYSHTCAIATDGTVWCWGNNISGQIGRAIEACDARPCSNPIPAQVSGLPPGVVAVTAAYNWTCALERDGTVWCWGRNPDGELGDGTRTGRSTPKRVLPCGQ